MVALQRLFFLGAAISCLLGSARRAKQADKSRRDVEKFVYIYMPAKHCTGKYEMEDYMGNGFPVWKKISDFLPDCWLCFDMKNVWQVSIEDPKNATGNEFHCNQGLISHSGKAQPYQLHRPWQVANGTAFHDEGEIVVTPKEADFTSAVDAAREAADALMKSAKAIVYVHVPNGHKDSTNCSGTYRKDSRIVNDLPVWKKTSGDSGSNRWLYYGTGNFWHIGTDAVEQENFCCNKGLLCHYGHALPDQLSGPWAWFDYEAAHFVVDDDIIVTSEEEAVKAAGEAKEALVKSAKETVYVHVAKGHEDVKDCIGIYHKENSIANGYPVWRKSSGASRWLYHSPTSWLISSDIAKQSNFESTKGYVSHSGSGQPYELTEPWISADENGVWTTDHETLVTSKEAAFAAAVNAAQKETPAAETETNPWLVETLRAAEQHQASQKAEDKRLAVKAKKKAAKAAKRERRASWHEEEERGIHVMHVASAEEERLAATVAEEAIEHMVEGGHVAADLAAHRASEAVPIQKQRRLAAAVASHRAEEAIPIQTESGASMTHGAEIGIAALGVLIFVALSSKLII